MNEFFNDIFADYSALSIDIFMIDEEVITLPVPVCFRNVNNELHPFIKLINLN